MPKDQCRGVGAPKIGALWASASETVRQENPAGMVLAPFFVLYGLMRGLIATRLALSFT